MNFMDITTVSSMLPHDDPGASLSFCRDTLGFEVRNDVDYSGTHWITSINLATRDIDRTFERLQAGDAEVVRSRPSSRAESGTALSATRQRT